MFEFDLFNRSSRTVRPPFAAEALECRDTPTNLAPVIEDFTSYEIMPNLFCFSGRVVDENPGNMLVTLGGDTVSIQGFTLTTDEYGYFSTMIYLQGDGTDTGNVTATVFDDESQMSNVPQLWVNPAPNY